MRTGAAVGAGFSVLGEGGLDADMRAHVGLTRARPAPRKATRQKQRQTPRVQKNRMMPGFELPEFENLISTSTWRERYGSIPKISRHLKLRRT